jgi:hypothetical protein
LASFVVLPVITSRPLRLPYVPNTCLTGFTRLDGCLPQLEFCGNAGISGPSPLSFTACRWPYSGSHAGVHTLCFPTCSGLLPVCTGSACIPAMRSLSLTRTLPTIPARIHFTKLHHSLYATACGFGQYPWLGTTRFSASLLGTVSGQVQPACYHANPPPAYTSIRATDVITSFHVIR